LVNASSIGSGYGKTVAQDGNKLEIDFEHAGLKKVLDSFVSAG
jgi:DNA helicase II / ATP-dependent DNA helicase PcrA